MQTHTTSENQNSHAAHDLGQITTNHSENQNNPEDQGSGQINDFVSIT